MVRVCILLYSNTKLRFFAAFRRFLSIWLLRGEYIGILVLGVGLYASTRLIMMLDVSWNSVGWLGVRCCHTVLLYVILDLKLLGFTLVEKPHCCSRAPELYWPHQYYSLQRYTPKGLRKVLRLAPYECTTVLTWPAHFYLPTFILIPNFEVNQGIGLCTA